MTTAMSKVILLPHITPARRSKHFSVLESGHTFFICDIVESPKINAVVHLSIFFPKTGVELQLDIEGRITSDVNEAYQCTFSS